MCYKITNLLLKLNKKKRKLTLGQLGIPVMYSISNLRNFVQQKTCLEYMVAVDEA